MAGATTMARPKKTRAARPKVSARTSMTNRALRMTQEYADWLERFAASERTTVSGILDRAAAELAKRVGYPEEPPPRAPR
jgi:hypothetical protein